MGVDDEQGPWWTLPPEPGPDSGTQRTRPRTDGHASDDTAAPQPQPEPPADDPFAPFVLSAPPSTPSSAPEEQTQFLEPSAPPEPAPPPPPPPAPRTAIRRVAVVAPDSPDLEPGGVEPGSARREHQDREHHDTARTETLPPVQDDIFAVFAGPGAQPTARSRPPEPDPYRPDPRDPDPLGHLRDDPHDRHLPHVPMPSPRVLLIGAAGGLVVVLIVITALLTGGGNGGNGNKVADTATAKAAASKAATPKGLTKLNANQATDLLAKAGEGNPGTIVEAWDWTDKNGQNLVVTATVPGSGGKKTLKVIQVARLDQDKPRTLRVMRDPDLPAKCKGSGTADFTPGTVVVRDLNGDGIAEVTAGWTSRCGTDPTVAKLALITNGKKYIIRGEGQVGQKGSGTVVPDPRTSSWPKAFLKDARALFSKLYY